WMIGIECQAPKKIPILPFGGSAFQKRHCAGRSASSLLGSKNACVAMWRGSIHSFSRFTVSPLPAPSTPAIRISTGKLPFCFRSYCALSSASRSFGSSRRNVALSTLCFRLADSNIARPLSECGRSAFSFDDSRDQSAPEARRFFECVPGTGELAAPLLEHRRVPVVDDGAR